MENEPGGDGTYILRQSSTDPALSAEEVSSLIAAHAEQVEPGVSGEAMLTTRSALEEVALSSGAAASSHQETPATDVSRLTTPAEEVDLLPDDEDDETDKPASRSPSQSVKSLSGNEPSDEDRESSPKRSVDLLNSPAWKCQRKHIFVLSESGKPIYSLHGNEEHLVTLFGVMQALVSVVEDSQDQLLCVRSDAHLIVFLQRPPLTLVGVSRAAENRHQMALQLVHVYDQILSVATLAQLRRISERRRNFDFRKLVSGAERYLDRLLSVTDASATYLLEAVQCLRVATSDREAVVGVVQSCCASIKKHLVFALLLCYDRLVCLVRMKGVSLHPADFLVICNVVSSTTTYRSVEGWTPICLPQLDADGFLFAHISYVSDECPDVCVVLVSSDREAFHQLSHARAAIIRRLTAARLTDSLADACSDANRDYSVRDTGAAWQLRHFMYKSVPTAQFTCPRVEGVYSASEAGRARLSAVYHIAHGRLHAVCGSGATSDSKKEGVSSLRTFYCAGSGETVVAWRNFVLELYAVFEPHVSVAEAVGTMNRVLAWIMSHERRVFIMSAPVF